MRLEPVSSPIATAVLSSLVVLVLSLPMVRAQQVPVPPVSPAEQITAFRLKHGEVRVVSDAVLDRIAADQAREMAAKDDLSHEVLGPFGKRIAPSQAGRAGENIAYGYNDFERTLGQWIHSPEHLKNLLLHNATRVGIASAKTANGKRTYWAMEIAGDYETKPAKGKGKPKDKLKDKPPAVAQTKPDAKSETHWGAKLPSKPVEKDCHLNIKLIGLCI